MSNWKKFFSKQEFHGWISNAGLLMIEKVFREAQDLQVISNQTYSQILSDLSVNVNQDLTTIIRCFYTKYKLNFDPNHWQTVNSLSVCKVLEKKLQSANQPDKLQRIRSLGWRVREAEPILKFLKEARNVAAHDMSPRKTKGWLTLVPASVIRITEICPHPKNTNDLVNDILTSCHEQILVQLELDNISSTTDQTEIPKPQESASGGPNHENVIELQLDRIEEMLAQQSKSPLATKENNTDKVSKSFEVEDIEPPEIDWLTPAMLKQELLSLKEDCFSRFKDDVELSPKRNFFQGPCINNIIAFRPMMAKEVIRLPDFGWRYKENIGVLGKQFNYYSKTLDELLSRVDWD